MTASAKVLGPRDKRLHEADTMSPEMRACVHEYGLPIVLACKKAGVTEPKRIHELVREIWAGAREHSQRRSPASTLEWYFMQAGIDLNASTLLRLLKNQNLIIVPDMATRPMIEASMATVAKHNLKVTKREKHYMRLNAALAEGAKHLLRLTGSSPVDGHSLPSQNGKTP